MKTRPALHRVLGLLCAITGGLQEAAVYGQSPSQNQPAESPGKVLYQEVVVTQKSACRIQGLDSHFDLRYGVLSSLNIKEHDDGGLDVEQKIEAAKLLQADDAIQALFSSLLQKLTGATFTIVFGPGRELIRFDGVKDRLHAGGAPAIGQTILLASLIDRDGWKELARYSFFQPHKPLRPRVRWDQSISHSWGFLGSWTGQVSFGYAGQQGDLQRFPYAFNLTYVPPKPEARDLLFPVSKASFKHGKDGGTIYFDPGKQRVSRVEERFHVKGQMTVEVLGQNLPVDLDEEQSFQVRLLEQDPRLRQASEPGHDGLRPGAAVSGLPGRDSDRGRECHDGLRPGAAVSGRKAKQQEPKADTETDYRSPAGR